MRKSFFDYIMTAKKLTIFNSYVKLADYLNVPAQRLTDWKLQRGRVEPAECVLLAILLGLDPAEIAFTIKAEREINPEKVTQWLNLAEQYARPVNPPDKYKKHK
ncbi:hypothetical protein [Escherichia coli]|uniref:hypothetical protein n=1 Tax=Escherichia coli TaxID=562 RepID=UPI000BDF9E48|nr:hypothetical protein [Escherichia coli]PCS38716.1 hypothetical protein BMR38_25435 [Escherichia coli]PHL32604.1 hypothetical protein BMR39_02290 [Escherichia coli]